MTEGSVARDGERYYVRFGGLPEGGRSEVYGAFLGAREVSLFGLPLYEHDGPKEHGVSVFEATYRDGALVVDTLSAEGWRRRGCFKAFTCSPGVHDRPVYVVFGDVVGCGSAAEPLLRNCSLYEVPLTVPVFLDSYAGDRELLEGVESWNWWRYVDGTREGRRTPVMGRNFLEAYAPPHARKILHEANEKKWRRSA